MLSIKKFVVAPVLLIVVTIPLLVLAEATTEIVDITSFNQIESVLTRILTWIQSIFFIIAAIFIIIAAFVYLTAGGDEAKVKTAKKMIINAIIAIAIALVALSIKGLVKTLLTGQG